MATTVEHKNVQIPNFIKNDANYWFMIVDRALASQKVEDAQQKFDLVLQALPEHIQLEIKPTVVQIINAPHDANYHPYDTLKAKVIDAVTIPETQRLTQLLEKESIGTRTPSQFLTQLRNLQGDNPNAQTDNKYLHHIFLKNLPTNTRTLLVAQKDQTLDQMAATADLVHNMNAPSRSISNINLETPIPNIDSHTLTHTNDDNLHSKIAKISFTTDENKDKQRDSEYRITRLERQLKDQEEDYKKLINDLKSEITELCTSVRQLTYQRSSTRSNDRGRSSSRTGKSHSQHQHQNSSNSSFNNGLCYYHYHYGDNARNCVQPCNYQSGNQ